MNYTVVSSNWDISTGVGKHSNALFGIHKKRILPSLNSISLPRIIQILVYFFQLLINRKNTAWISPTVTVPGYCDIVHCSSCHFYSIVYVYRQPWRLILPSNLLLVLFELYHFRFSSSTIIMLSKEELRTFEKAYGNTRKNVTITPLVSSVRDNLSYEVSTPYRIVWVGYSDFLKGLDIVYEMLEMLEFSELDIYGIDHSKYHKELPNAQITYHGKVAEIDFQKYDFLIHPSRLDSFGLVVVEAAEKGCIPIVSKLAGAAELIERMNKDLVFDMTPEENANIVAKRIYQLILRL